MLKEASRAPMAARIPIWRTLIAMALTIALLAPVALLLRTQQPWNCFQMTYDENVFIQASYNWAEGRGFRLGGDIKPYEPRITVGEPMAWGSRWMKLIFREDWPQAGRLWVYLNFVSLLLMVSWSAIRRSGTWSAGLVCAALFGLMISRTPAAPYLVYGFMGEIPAAVLGWLSLMMLDRRRYLRAGLLAAACFFTKPSFLPLIPCICLTSLLWHRRRGLFTCLAAAAGLTWALAYIASRREQGLADYIREFAAFIQGFSSINQTQRLWDYYSGAGPVVAAFSILIPLLLFFRRRSGRVLPSEFAAGSFFVLGCLYYLLSGRKPIEKHWFVFFILGGSQVCARLSGWAGPVLARFLGDELVQTVGSVVVITWVLNVPGMVRRGFIRSNEMDCAVKEQRAIDRELSALQVRGKITHESVAYVMEPAAAMFLHLLTPNPPHFNSWEAFRRAHAGKELPRLIVGDHPTLGPPPAGCAYRFKGGLYGLLECGGP